MAAASAAFAKTVVGIKRKQAENEPENSSSIIRAAPQNYYCSNPWTNRCEVYVANEHEGKDAQPKTYQNEKDCLDRCNPGQTILLDPLLDLVFGYEPNLIVNTAFDVKQGEQFRGDTRLSEVERNAQQRMASLLKRWKGLEYDDASTDTSVEATKLMSRMQRLLMVRVDTLSEDGKRATRRWVAGPIQRGLTPEQADSIIEMFRDIFAITMENDDLDEAVQQYWRLMHGIQLVNPGYANSPHATFQLWRNLFDVDATQADFSGVRAYFALMEKNTFPTVAEYRHELRHHEPHLVHTLKERYLYEVTSIFAAGFNAYYDSWLRSPMSDCLRQTFENFPWNFCIALLETFFHISESQLVVVNAPNTLRQLLLRGVAGVVGVSYPKHPTYDEGRTLFQLLDAQYHLAKERTKNYHLDINTKWASYDEDVKLLEDKRDSTHEQRRDSNGVKQLILYIYLSDWDTYRRYRRITEHQWLTSTLSIETDPKIKHKIQHRLVELDREAQGAPGVPGGMPAAAAATAAQALGGGHPRAGGAIQIQTQAQQRPLCLVTVLF